MKHVFIRLAFDAAIATNGGATQQTVAPKQEPTSPKLDELKAAYVAAYGEMLKHTDPFADATKTAKLAVWKLEGEMEAEKANIRKAENEAMLQEKRNERLALNTAQFAAYDAFIAEKSKKNPDAAKLAELESAFKTAKELVDNELLAKYAGSKPAKKTEGGDDKTPVIGETSANKAAIIEMYQSGKTHKEIEDAGYKRSTVWHTIDKAIKAGVVTKH